MGFEWDEGKSARNLVKHGISLAEATRLWEQPVLVLPSRFPGESRMLAIGTIDGKHWTAIAAGGDGPNHQCAQEPNR